MVQIPSCSRDASIRENEERWKELCALAAKEQDPVKLHALIREINELLAMKQKRLQGAPDKSETSPLS
jgi:hypothetical protein